MPIAVARVALTTIGTAAIVATAITTSAASSVLRAAAILLGGRTKSLLIDRAEVRASAATARAATTLPAKATAIFALGAVRGNVVEE